MFPPMIVVILCPITSDMTTTFEKRPSYGVHMWQFSLLKSFISNIIQVGRAILGKTAVQLITNVLESHVRMVANVFKPIVGTFIWHSHNAQYSPLLLLLPSTWLVDVTKVKFMQNHNRFFSAPVLFIKILMLVYCLFRFLCSCIDKWYGLTCEERPSTTTETVGISLAVSCAAIFFFTGCCSTITRLRLKDRRYGKYSGCIIICVRRRFQESPWYACIWLSICRTYIGWFKKSGTTFSGTLFQNYMR